MPFSSKAAIAFGGEQLRRGLLVFPLDQRESGWGEVKWQTLENVTGCAMSGRLGEPSLPREVFLPDILKGADDLLRFGALHDRADSAVVHRARF